MLGAISSALMIFGTLLPVAVVSYRPPLRHSALILRFLKAAIHQVQQTTRCSPSNYREEEGQVGTKGWRAFALSRLRPFNNFSITLIT
jgi:hypothetical protein